jgi:RHS repeat-associated protein
VHGFQGLRLDTSVNIYDDRYRILLPSIGRFGQTDPTGFGGGDTNFYRGFSNSPGNHADPYGLMAMGTYNHVVQPFHFRPPKQKPDDYSFSNFLDDLGTVGPFGSIGIGAETLRKGFLDLILDNIVPGRRLVRTYKKYKAYRQLGLTVDDSIYFTFMTETPIVNAVMNLAELIEGKSAEPGDFGKDLTWDGKVGRAANITTTVTIILAATIPGGKGNCAPGNGSQVGDAPANPSTTPGGRPLSPHYEFGENQGPVRNIPGSVVDHVIDNHPGVPVAGGKTVYYDPINDVTVVTGNQGIVSVHRGPPRPGQLPP